MGEIAVLDRREEIKGIDKNGMLDIYAKIPEYCRDAIQKAKQIKIPVEVKISADAAIAYNRPRRVLIIGMGGSAIGGEILRDWLRYEISVPIEIWKDYTLPAYIDNDTLVFALSYSGETEETLSAFLDAVKRGCMTITLTSGGHLLSFSERLKIPYITLPGGLPPRAAIPYLLFPILIIMEKMGVPLNMEEEIGEALQTLEKLSKETALQTPTANNPSKRLALELDGTMPVVYGFRQYESLARRLKTQFNENSKLPSWYDVFPELDHNEVEGWNAPEAFTKQFSVLLLRDPDEPPEIKHKIEITKLLALKRVNKVLEIHARGKKKLAKILSLLHVGDLATIYLAILRKTDPTPTENIKKIRKEMKRRLKVIEKLKEELRRMVERKSSDLDKQTNFLLAFNNRQRN